MDVRKLALLKALDDAERTTYSEQLLAWQKRQAVQSKEDPNREAPPQYIEVRTHLERIARDNGVTLNDVVLIALGRTTRGPVTPLAADILTKIPAPLLALVRSIHAQWPEEEPDFIAPPTEPKPVTIAPILPKVGPRRGSKKAKLAHSNPVNAATETAPDEAPDAEPTTHTDAVEPSPS